LHAKGELFAVRFDSVKNPAIVNVVSTDRGIEMDDTPLIEQPTDATGSAADPNKEAALNVVSKPRRAKAAAKQKAAPKRAAKAKKVATKKSAKKTTKKAAKKTTTKKATKKTAKKTKKAKKG
jgi:hypothetical protein